MTGLANLIALQNKGKTNAVPATSKVVSDGDSSQGNVLEHSDAPSVDELPPADATPPKPVAPRLTGLNLLGKLGGVRPAASKPTTPSLAKAVASAADDTDDSGSNDGAVFGLADLARFDASDAPVAVDPLQASQSSWFDDEIEATAPDRILEPDLTAQQLDFVESLDGIYQVLNDPEMFGQAIRIIMMELQENREYMKLIQDQDVHVMLRAMRNTMGLARIKKQEKSRTKGSGTAKAGRAKKSSVSEADLGLLDAIMGGGGE